MFAGATTSKKRERMNNSLSMIIVTKIQDFLRISIVQIVVENTMKKDLSEEALSKHFQSIVKSFIFLWFSVPYITVRLVITLASN